MGGWISPTGNIKPDIENEIRSWLSDIFRFADLEDKNVNRLIKRLTEELTEQYEVEYGKNKT